MPCVISEIKYIYYFEYRRAYQNYSFINQQLSKGFNLAQQIQQFQKYKIILRCIIKIQPAIQNVEFSIMNTIKIKECSKFMFQKMKIQNNQPYQEKIQCYFTCYRILVLYHILAHMSLSLNYPSIKNKNQNNPMVLINFLI
ncbi:hypothetical protein pb186bvf_011827 [Paramecium bursaria]